MLFNGNSINMETPPISAKGRCKINQNAQNFRAGRGCDAGRVRDAGRGCDAGRVRDAGRGCDAGREFVTQGESVTQGRGVCVQHPCTTYSKTANIDLVDLEIWCSF